MKKKKKLVLILACFPALDWNPGGNHKILGLHGWLDNAATFNRLAPLLPSTANFISIDFPGHGFSSHYPLGANLSVIDFPFAAKRVIEYLQWEKYSVIAHSMGMMTSFMLSAMFPEHMDRIVALDQLNTKPAEIEDLYKYRRDAFKAAMAMGEAKSYNMEFLLSSLTSANMGEKGMDPESAKILLSRSVSQVGEDSYVLNRDFRYRKFRNFIFLSHHEHSSFADAVKSDVLLLQSKQGLITTSEFGNFVFQYPPKNAKSFSTISVEGGHHVHLDNPELIAPHIIDFLGLGNDGKPSANL